MHIHIIKRKLIYHVFYFKFTLLRIPYWKYSASNSKPVNTSSMPLKLKYALGSDKYAAKIDLELITTIPGGKVALAVGKDR